ARDAAVQHAELDAQVGLGGLLPLEVRVGRIVRVGGVPGRGGRAEVVRGAQERALGLVRTDGRVAGHAVATAQLEGVEESESPHERLVPELPCQADGREGHPLVPGRQLAGAVAADRGRDSVTVPQRVDYATNV